MKKNLLLILLITLISCEVTNKNFEISSPNFTYEFHENYIERGLNLAGRVEFVKNKIQTGEEDYDMLKKKVYNNIRTISLNLNVKNITGENLEESKLYTTIIFEYPNETKEFNFDSKRINLDNSSLWYNDEIKTINFEYAFNFLVKCNIFSELTQKASLLFFRLIFLKKLAENFCVISEI